MEIGALRKRVVRLLTLLTVPLIAVLLATNGSATAQTSPVELEWLTVDIWPDFDREAALVLLTGSLAEGVTTPVEITIPLPPQADVNAVARIDETDSLLADLDPSIGDEAVTFTLPDRRFRVEYYFPYEADGLTRSFAFNWLAPALNVQNLSLAIQQPALATEMDTDPAAEAITEGNDQLDYYNLPDTSVPAGEAYTVDVTYTMSEERLTIATADNPPAAASGDVPEANDADGLAVDWPVVLGIVGAFLIGVALAWQLFGERLTGRSAPRKPRPVRASKTRARERGGTGQARFCHNCGERAQADDRFCRECGTRLKGA